MKRRDYRSCSSRRIQELYILLLFDAKEYRGISVSPQSMPCIQTVFSSFPRSFLLSSDCNGLFHTTSLLSSQCFQPSPHNTQSTRWRLADKHKTTSIAIRTTKLSVSATRFMALQTFTMATLRTARSLHQQLPWKGSSGCWYSILTSAIHNFVFISAWIVRAK